MNKLFTKIAALALGMTMATGVGVAVATSSKETRPADADVGQLVYTLDGTITGSGNAYASGHDTTQSSITWNVTGNIETNPWRIGGKGITKVDRPIYSKTAITNNIAEIKVASGATASSCTVNSLTITVHSTAADAESGSNAVATKTFTSGIASSTVTFTKEDSTSWANKYFRIVYNVTRTGTSGNGYVAFSNAKFYEEAASGKEDVELDLSGSASMNLGETQTLTVAASSGGSPVTGLTYTYSSSDDTVLTVTNGGVVTAEGAGTATVSVHSAATDDYNAGTGTLEITVTEVGVVIDLNFPSCNDSTVSNYTSTWTATNNGYTVSIFAANNNFADHIRIGRNNSTTSYPTVTTPQVEERITSVVLIFSAVNTNLVTEATLKIANNSSFTNADEIDFTSDVDVGTTTIDIPNSISAENLYYEIYFEIAGSGNNGQIHIDQIKFKAEEVVTLDSLTISNYETTYTAGSSFGLGGSASITADYSDGSHVAVAQNDSGLTYTLNGVSVNYGANIPVAAIGSNKSLVVAYEDSEGNTASSTLSNITIEYKGALTIELNLSSVTLSLNQPVSLTATVTDEYADPNAISWSTSSSAVASISATSGTKTITVTGVAAGTATITATANGHSATCAVTVSADPILNIKDAQGNIINDATLERYTGDESVMLLADSENVDSPVYSWTNEDDNVVTIDTADEYCEVTIVGAGTSEVSVTVGLLTRKVTFSVTASAVTSLTLTSSVQSGEIYHGTYQNTLTLTPAVTKIGNATAVVNWASDDTSVATVSSASTTAPTAITVTAAGEGTATITATSAYTPSLSASFVVTVTEDSVTNLSWTKRPKFNSGASGYQTIWAGETTLGDLMSQNGSDGIGVFTPTWKSSKTDSPTMGTGAHDVHIGLYDVGGPTVETTPITSSYVFKAEDNGKYVVAFYEGKASTNNTQLSITNWRSVIESSEASSTITWSSSEATITGDAVATVTNVQYTYYENNSLRLGTGSGGGRIRIDTDADITSVVITAKAYSDSRKGNLTVGDQTISVTNTDYVEFDETVLGTPTNSLVVSTPSSNVRINIQSIVINCSGSQDIGKTEDCLGLESFIDTNLHMKDYTTSQGWCADEEHHYYATAKAAYNSLNTHQKSLFVGNSAYALEYARLSAWAAANGEKFNSTTNNLEVARITPLIGDGNSFNAIIVIVIVSVISVSAIGGYFFLRKKREN